MTKEQFIERLECWIKQDLINLLKIKPVSGCGGCNFPIALYTLSCMEWLGFLLRGCGASKSQLDSTSENLDGCLDYFPAEYQSSLVRSILKSLFRNGLVHQFGPKFSGISRGNIFHPPIVLMQDTFAPVLDADQLANEFIKVIDNIKSMLETNEIDYAKIRDKTELTFKYDRKEFEKVIATWGLEAQT